MQILVFVQTTVLKLVGPFRMHLNLDPNLFNGLNANGNLTNQCLD